MDDELAMTEAEWEKVAGDDLPTEYPNDPGDDEGAITEAEYETTHADDPPEAGDPVVEPTHPPTTSDEGGT